MRIVGVGKKSANHKWTPSQKWVRIAEAPRKAVAKIPEANKTPEEVEKHTAMILYLQEDFLNHSAYFPSIIEVSFDKHGCPVILQTYRERLSGMTQKRMVNLILDKVGDFIFKKTIIQQK